jgi:leader peptidase (prepilin peptidase)/N-methyltransferase
MTMPVFEVFAALLGACVGSFLNVVIYRLPHDDPAKRSLGGRSACPRCGSRIAWYWNLPVLGWLLLRGKASCCGGRIAWRYPLVELLTAGLFLLLALQQPWGAVFRELANGDVTWNHAALVAFAAQALFLSLLVANSFIDLDTQLLLDVLTKPGMALGLLFGLWPGVAGVLTEEPGLPVALNTLLASLFGLLVGGGVIWAVRIVGSRIFRQEAMGFGDVKFLAMIGAFLGWRAALLTLLLGCVVGAAVGSLSALRGGAARIPFGPYLAIGAAIALFAEAPILHFVFHTWPAWQRSSAVAQWLLPVAALFCLFALLALVRRGRRAG